MTMQTSCPETIPHAERVHSNPSNVRIDDTSDPNRIIADVRSAFLANTPVVLIRRAEERAVLWEGGIFGGPQVMVPHDDPEEMATSR